jgi:hypothetical protein
MKKSRFEEIIWEMKNAPAKFKEHAHEYFVEVLPILEDAFSNIPTREVKEKPNPSTFNPYPRGLFDKKKK